MKLKMIIWATDGSQESERALDYAKYIAGKSGAEIVGVHVVPMPVQLLFHILSDSKAEIRKWGLRIENNAAKKFDEVKEELQKTGIKFDGVILKGVPSDKIKEHAERRKADLIVMGKHGHGFFESMIAGSETIRVLKSSHVPVLAVKGKNNTNKAEFKNILVPIDLSEKSDTALTYALNIAQLTGAKITVIFVLRLDIYAQEIPAGALELATEQSIKSFNKSASQIKKAFDSKRGTSKNIKMETEVIYGMSEAVKISQYAEKHNIDLIVIHTHGKTGITRFLLGSVTERVVSAAQCSIIAMRPE
ncbi:MAG: universal stress protein [Candidatus Dadabacteria bacterium]|nr:universal stress protein [Candidatus Dadabacteria bacterium]